MEFQNGFAVQAPIDEVWATMLDVERVAPCVPGAKVLSRTGEDAYEVAIKVKLGPITQQYQGQIEIVERDPAGHSAVMRARARETRGQGNAEAKVRMRLESGDGTTRGTIDTDMALSGKAAAMGSGMMKEVAGRLTDQFAANLAAMLQQAPEAEPEETGTSPQAAVAGVPAARVESAAAPTTTQDDAALPVLDLVGDMVRARLQSPAAIAGSLLGAFFLGILLGRRRGR